MEGQNRRGTGIDTKKRMEKVKNEFQLDCRQWKRIKMSQLHLQKGSDALEQEEADWIILSWILKIHILRALQEQL
jgi:hypothetical protein